MVHARELYAEIHSAVCQETFSHDFLIVCFHSPALAGVGKVVTAGWVPFATIKIILTIRELAECAFEAILLKISQIREGCLNVFSIDVIRLKEPS